MRPVEFGGAVAAGTRLTLFSDDKPDRLFTVITFLIDAVSGVALDLETGVPCYQVEDEEGRIHLLLHLALTLVQGRPFTSPPLLPFGLLPLIGKRTSRLSTSLDAIAGRYAAKLGDSPQLLTWVIPAPTQPSLPVDRQ